MDDALDEIMALRQEGTVKKYCDEFQFLLELVKNSEEMSEYYAIYLFMDGLEPEIRDIFQTWHQYSFHTLKDNISLALKLDANKLSDTLSPYDPKSSLYIMDLEFDFRKSIDEIMGKNEVSNEDKLFDGIIHKVFDEIPKKCSNQEAVDSKIQDLVKMPGKISNQEVVDSEIQDLVHFDLCNDIHEKDINVKCINIGNDLCDYLRNDTPRDDQSEDTSNEDMKVEVVVCNPKYSEK
ncbi:hypothetical protein HanRHA438_Chr15g0706291 [Helianthus annuus]|nr:hypothetical protein HanRHA438_Chr15g0706291 [Helianthus annuus]